MATVTGLTAARMIAIENEILARATDVETTTEARMVSVETTTAATLAAVDADITTRMTAVETSTAASTAAVDADITARMGVVETTTATRMNVVEGESIVNAHLASYDLVLTTFAGLDINVGNVRGVEGPASTVNTDASLLTSGTLSDALLPVGSNGATVASKATPADISAAIAALVYATPSSVTAEVAALVNSAPATLDTLGEIATALAADESAAAALVTTVGGKAGIVESVNTVAVSGAAQTIPAVTVATLNVITLSAACTFTFPSAVVGKSFTLILKAGGAFAVTWPGIAKWAGGTAPTLTTTVGKFDAFSFVCADGTNWLGFVGGKNY